MSIPDPKLAVSAETTCLLGSLNRFRNFGVSRRDAFTRVLGASGALGALQLLSAREARADDSQQHGDGKKRGDGQIDPSLLQALRFERENSDDPGVVFSSDNGLLVGFGPNLYHADSSTTGLFVRGQQVLKSSITKEDVAENISALAPGVSGTVVQTTQDRYGRVTDATITVESIHDPPDDFLVTGKTESERYTGAFFRITVSVGTPQANIATFKTTCNLLTRSFPLDFNVIRGSLFNQPPGSIIDVDAVRLLGIALQIMTMELSALDALIPTDLQQDFPWRKIFRHVVVTLAFGPVGETAHLLLTEPKAREAAGTALLWLLLAVLSGISGNYAYDKLKDMANKAEQPPPPPPGEIE